MSAIFGILRFDGGAVVVRDLERMASTLAHRAPDGRKVLAVGPAGLGHGLMRVNREDMFEAQPLHNRDADVTLVADARIDNREALAQSFGIAAAALRDMPDGALIMRAYQQWGEGCADHLLGDFAFAIWDGRAKKLVLGRDHMGQRTVHYHRAENFLAFATEIKALWALADVPRKLDAVQLGRHLVADSRARDGATLFENIRGVPGGTTVAIGAGGALSERRYWAPHAAPEHVGRDEAYYIETYRRVFAEAVACRIRRLIAQPALCLSAGYDSAGIAGLAGPVLSAQGRKLTAVASVMPENYSGPLRSVRRWVEMCRRDMPHLDARYVVSGERTVFSNAGRMFVAIDGPPRAAQYVTDALFATASAAGSRLVMDGLGGDSTINQRGGEALAYFLRRGQFGRFLREVGPHLRMSGHSLWQTLRFDIAALLAPNWMRRIFWAARRRLAPPWSVMPIASGYAETLRGSGAISDAEMMGRFWFEHRPHARMLRALNNFTAAARRIDANEAAIHGLDMTRPLLDKRVVEFGLAIPEGLFVKNGRNRYLACRALADVYPPEFQTRDRHQDLLDPDQVGMLDACRPALMAEIDDMARDPALRAYFDFDKMAKALRPSPGPMLSREAGLALHAFSVARYIAWFNGANRPPP